MNNIEEIFDSVQPNQINLKSFEMKNTLCSKIWNDDGTIKEAVRNQLLKIANKFIEDLNIENIYPVDILVIGSIANYNWSKYSDIDLHIIYDVKSINKDKDLVLEYFDTKKTLWNIQHEDLNIYGFPVELYAQDIDDPNDSEGIYSLLKNGWIKIPHLQNYELNKKIICTQSSKIINEIEDLEDKVKRTKDKKKLKILRDKVKNLYKYLTGTRREALNTVGEHAPENIIYKVIRRTGHLDRLRDLKIITFDKINSL